PFAAAIALRPLGDGTFAAELPSLWTVGNKAHGGFLTALLAKAALTAHSGNGQLPPEPLAVSVQFLHAPEVGPALVRTETRKAGRQATVTAVRLEQRGRSCVEATV